MNAQDREHLAALLGEAPAIAVLQPEKTDSVVATPRTTEPAGPWRVRKADVEAYLRKGKPW